MDKMCLIIKLPIETHNRTSCSGNFEMNGKIYNGENLTFIIKRFIVKFAMVLQKGTFLHLKQVLIFWWKYFSNDSTNLTTVNCLCR